MFDKTEELLKQIAASAARLDELHRKFEGLSHADGAYVSMTFEVFAVQLQAHAQGQTVLQHEISHLAEGVADVRTRLKELEQRLSSTN